MNAWTLLMMSLEQAFLAASCSTTVSRKMRHSIRPPLHLTLEARVSPELRTWSHTRPASRFSILISSQDPGRRSLNWLWGSADIPEPSKSTESREQTVLPQWIPDKLRAAAAFPSESSFPAADRHSRYCFMFQQDRPLQRLSDFNFFLLSGFEFYPPPQSTNPAPPLFPPTFEGG